MRSILPVLVVLSLAPASSQEPVDTQPAQGEWRAFRGSDSTASSSYAVPLEWSDTKNIAWKAVLPGPGTSSPILVGDSLFITCWSGYGLDKETPGKAKNLKRHLLKISRDDGKILWDRTIDPTPTEDEFGGRMSVHGYASSTPVSDGKHVYVFFGKSGVFAFDLEGEQIWHSLVGKKSSQWQTGSGSSLTLDDSRLFINASDESHSIRALKKDTGEEVWKRSSPDFDQSYGTPLLTRSVKDPILLHAFLGGIWGLSPRTGKSKWTIKTKTNGALAPSMILGVDDTMYSFGGQSGTKSMAIKLGGKGDVTKTHIKWDSRYGSYVTSPLLYDEHLYWVNEGGIFYCADGETGELVFKQRLDGAFYASPVLAGDAIYLVSRESGTFVVAAKPEFKQLAHNLFKSDETHFDGTPALDQGGLYLRSRKLLYCIR